MINWNSPNFSNKELTLVKEVLKTGYVSEGPMTKELEKQLSEICGAKHIIMTTNATAALYLAIEADKRIRNYTDGTVAIPNLTFIATKNAVEMANLKVEYTDVNPTNFMLVFNKKGKQPRIIIPVNLLGRNIPSIHQDGDIKSTIIMDNAGCLGSNVSNGKVGCYSLQANKLLTCGQGGFCATDDDEYAKVIREIKDFGRKDKYDQETIGFNFKFNDIQAAVALGQLQQFNKRAALHLQQYLIYRENLSEYGRFIDYNLGEIPLWIEFITDNILQRNALLEYLKANGVECRLPWKPLLTSIHYPVTTYYTNHTIWLPNGANLKHKDLKRIISLIHQFYESK